MAKQGPCWDGYVMEGMKKSKKSGKMVPNCVRAKKILETLEEGGKTSSSYYVSMQETVKACEKQELEPIDTE